MPKSWVDKLKGLWGFVPVAIVVTLYLARPYLETNHSPVIACAICDNQQDIHPPIGSHDDGATVTLAIDNTGPSATTIVEHNLSWWQILETDPTPNVLSEQPDANDKIEIPIGSHSSKYLRKSINEVIIFSLRNPVPEGSSIGSLVRDRAYLYGHVKYKMFFFPTTTEFCFQYVPANKGLLESWVVCPNNVHIKH